MSSLKIHILSLNQPPWEGLANEITFRDPQNSFSILKDHADLAAYLAPGAKACIQSTEGEKNQDFPNGAWVQVKNNTVKVLVKL